MHRLHADPETVTTCFFTFGPTPEKIPVARIASALRALTRSGFVRFRDLDPERYPGTPGICVQRTPMTRIRSPTRAHPVQPARRRHPHRRPGAADRRIRHAGGGHHRPRHACSAPSSSTKRPSRPGSSRSSAARCTSPPAAVSTKAPRTTGNCATSSCWPRTRRATAISAGWPPPPSWKASTTSRASTGNF